MKRLLLGIAILCGAAILGGCPIYPSQGSEYRVCDGTGCYSCPDTSYSGACISWQCATDADCGYGYVCSQQATCIPAPPPAPDAAAGDCSVHGCPDGYVCKLSNGVAQCVSLGGSDAGTGEGGSHPEAGGGNDASSGGDAATQGDASDAATAPAACNADGDCSGQGARCIDGHCAPRVGLCSDGSQCVVQGSACVDGVCEARCSITTPCPSGYGCDFTRGICNLNPGACTGSGTSSCQGGAVCVEGHCVPPCSASAEAGPACASGQVCINGGCIPDQAATFACANDGDQGQLANTCPSGSTCIHHDCYTACDADAGTSCPAAATGTVCKNVTTETGIYGVCGSATMLGSDCDPAQGKACATGVCVDGYCK